MRLAVSGGRYFNDVPLLWRSLDELHKSTPDGVQLLVEGASDEVTGPYQGADYWAHQWALARQVPCLREPAEWTKHGRAAGPIRNGVMLKKYLLDYLLAFPGGRGTANMIEQAEKAGVVIKVVRSPVVSRPPNQSEAK